MKTLDFYLFIYSLNNLKTTCTDKESHRRVDPTATAFEYKWERRDAVTFKGFAVICLEEHLLNLQYKYNENQK